MSAHDILLFFKIIIKNGDFFPDLFDQMHSELVQSLIQVDESSIFTQDIVQRILVFGRLRGLKQ